MIILLLSLLAACKKSGTTNPAVIPAGKATLTLPAQNAVCTAGTNMTATQSTVLFVWNAGAQADSYDLNIKNLLTGTSTSQHTSATQLAVALLLNTPYSWSVTTNASASNTNALSDAWKFYNSGPGITTYAPFPAELLTPTYGQQLTAATVNFTWQGSSVNTGSITAYDLCLGAAASPPLYKSGITDSFLNNVSLSPGTSYYWKIITHDNQGNTSDSGVYIFKTN
jgi:hypothetical protein